MAYKDLTVEELENIIKEEFAKIPPDNFKIAQYCLDQGWVNRSAMNLRICKNTECKPCQEFAKEFDKAMKDHGKELLNKDRA